MTVSRLILAGLLVFAAFPVVGVASACINNCQPLVYVCTSATSTTCGHTVCVAYGKTVPFCEDVTIQTQRVCR